MRMINCVDFRKVVLSGLFLVGPLLGMRSVPDSLCADRADWLAHRGNIDELEVLLRKHPGLARHPDTGFSLVLAAAQRKDKHLLEELDRLGADFNWRNPAGKTVLWYVVASGNHDDTAEVLLGFGVDPYIHDFPYSDRVVDERMVLELCVDRNKEELLKKLVLSNGFSQQFCRFSLRKALELAQTNNQQGFIDWLVPAYAYCCDMAPGFQPRPTIKSQGRNNKFLGTARAIATTAAKKLGMVPRTTSKTFMAPDYGAFLKKHATIHGYLGALCWAVYAHPSYEGFGTAPLVLFYDACVKNQKLDRCLEAMQIFCEAPSMTMESVSSYRGFEHCIVEKLNKDTKYPVLINGFSRHQLKYPCIFPSETTQLLSVQDRKAYADYVGPLYFRRELKNPSRDDTYFIYR